jgi:hypothetical protein
MEWCCDGFKYAYTFRHERGLFVFALPPDSGVGKPSFHIGCRAVESVDIPQFQKLRREIGEAPVTVNLQAHTRMRFCPWCGKSVLRHYRQSWTELIDEKITEEFGAPNPTA